MVVRRPYFIRRPGIVALLVLVKSVLIKTVLLFPVSVILEHLTVRNWCGTETGAECLLGDISDPGRPVIVGAVEMAAMDDHGMLAVLINEGTGLSPPSRGRYGSPAPMVMGVIGFERGQGNPSHVGTGVDP
jgi:hypothetical protein